MNAASICGPTCGAPLYVHVLGATVLFGGALAVTILAVAASWRPPEQALLLRRLAFWATLVLLVPGWVAMRIGGQWVLNHEHLDKSTPGWANAGFVVSDGGAVLILLLLLFSWLSWKRPRLGAIVAGLGTIYVLALGVAWFAMSAKPSW
jgi:hypothetical protein